MRPRVWLIVCFVISRILYFAAGIRFQTGRLASNFQFLDLTLLRTRLWETLYYCHGQPPLMNAVVGICLKLFPGHYGTALHVFYMLLGAAATLLLFQCMLYLGVGRRLAFLFTILFFASPGCVLYENYPLYEYEMMFLALLSGVLLYRLFARPSTRRAFYFFTALAALGWIRSLYHLYIIVAMLAVLCLFLWKSRWRVLAGAAGPVLSLFILYFKNLLVFGFFGCSSWLGANLMVVTAHQLSIPERLELVRDRQVSDLILVEPGEFVPRYRPYLPPIAKTGIPILDEDVKQTGGGPNTNNLVYLKIDPLYKKLAQQVLRERPKTYLKSLAIAVFCYLLPPTDFFHFEESRTLIRPLDRAINVLVFGQFFETTRKGLRELGAGGNSAKLIFYTGSFLIVIFPILLAWGAYLTWTIGGRAETALLAYLLFSVVFIFSTTTLLSSFENNRYRFPTDPIYVILFATLVQRSGLRYWYRLRLAKLH